MFVTMTGVLHRLRYFVMVMDLMMIAALSDGIGCATDNWNDPQIQHHNVFPPVVRIYCLQEEHESVGTTVPFRISYFSDRTTVPQKKMNYYYYLLFIC